MKNEDLNDISSLHLKAINIANLKDLGFDQDTLNIINAASASEFPVCINLINKYQEVKKHFLTIYNDENDVRIMFFTKILNTLYSYYLERVLINGLVDSDKKVQNYLNRLGLSDIVSNWENFKISHNLYNAFTCYIRIFSCLESTLREIYFYLNPNTNTNSFVSFSKIYNKLIDDNNLNGDYKDLLKLLATIRNLIHNMGVSSKNDSITYKNNTYIFEENKIPKANVLDLLNLLNLFENDIIDFITDLFNSNSIKIISTMKDNLSTELKDYETWVLNNL